MADVDTKEVEGKLEEPVEVDRFESEPEPVDKDEVPDGPTDEQVAAMQDAIDEENLGESEEDEQAEPEKKEETKSPETDKVEDTEKKPDLEGKPPEKPDETEISKLDSEPEEQPAVADTDFKPIKVEYVANGEKKEREINTVQDLQKLCSEAVGLRKKLSDTHVELQAMEVERDESRDRSKKAVQAYRRKEHQDKELEPFFDIFREYPKMRDVFLKDKTWGPILQSKGVEGTTVSYDRERAGHDYDVTEREVVIIEREMDDMHTAMLGEFAETYDVDGDTLVRITQHAIDRKAFDTEGRKLSVGDLRKVYYSEMEKSYAMLIRDGGIKTPAAKKSDDAKTSAEREVDQLKKMNEDHRSAPGSPGSTQTPTKPQFKSIDGEDSEERNRRWLADNPEAAAELNQGF